MASSAAPARSAVASSAGALAGRRWARRSAGGSAYECGGVD